MCSWFISERSMTSWKMTVFVILVGTLSTFLFYGKTISTLAILSPKLSNGQQHVNIIVHSNQTKSKERKEIFITQKVGNSNIKCNESFKASHIMTIGDFSGRTGNHMFKLIMLLSSARRYCYTPMLKPSIHLDSIFDFRKSILKRSSDFLRIVSPLWSQLPVGEAYLYLEIFLAIFLFYSMSLFMNCIIIGDLNVIL